MLGTIVSFMQTAKFVCKTTLVGHMIMENCKYMKEKKKRGRKHNLK